MTMLWTTLGFAAVTALLVRAHLRRTGRPASDGDTGAACPRCHAAARPGAQRCPACHVPLGAFDLVLSEAIPAAPAAVADGPARLHALVRGDLCVGCGTCAAACPEPGAITLAGKRAVVDRRICVGHGRCAEACPVGAIVMTSGDAVQRIEVPAVDVGFQSNVPGLYIVGELGGRGLIKNAINEGRIAVEHIAERLRPGGAGSRQDAAERWLDVVVVGTGPAGLSAALTARSLGLRCVVLERGSLADSIRKYPRHKLLLAEPVRMPLYGDLWIADASKESLLKVWESVISRARLDLRTGHEATQVERTPGGFAVATAGGLFHSRRVILAMGRRGVPRRLEVPGEDLGKVVYDVSEMEVFAGRRVLVVGAGDSAVETAVGLSRQEACEVTLSFRGERLSRVKPRNVDKFEEAARAGGIRPVPKSVVREIRDREVVLEVEGATRVLPNDDVIVRIGGEPPHEFLKRAGVRVVTKELRVATAKAGQAGP